MDDQVPVRGALIGCLALALCGILVVVLVRPAILWLADPRDDSSVVLGPTSITADGPIELGVVLSRSYGWPGEREVASGRFELRVIVSPSRTLGPTTVAAASPMRSDCPVTIGADRLTDCDGHAWTFEGFPLDTADPPLDRVPTTIDEGQLVADFTRTLDR